MPILQTANGLAGQTTLTVNRYEDGTEVSTLTITPASACETGYVVQLSNYTAGASDIAVRVVSQPALVPPPPMSLYGTLADAEAEKTRLVAELNEMAQDVFALRRRLEVAEVNTEVACRFVFADFGVEAALALNGMLAPRDPALYAPRPPRNATLPPRPGFPADLSAGPRPPARPNSPPRHFQEQPHSLPSSGGPGSLAVLSPPASYPPPAAPTPNIPFPFLAAVHTDVRNPSTPSPTQKRTDDSHPSTPASSSSSFAFLECSSTRSRTPADANSLAKPV
ncbi:hypothetical protein JCM8097_001290 [Rhodosporidiobolus ruineniae]